VGCSPAWPNPGGAQSGYLVNGSGTVLLDCGPGVLARLRQRESWPKVDAIVITHFHLDHWGDLVPWVWGSMYLQGRGDAPARASLWVPPRGIEQLEEFGARLERIEQGIESVSIEVERISESQRYLLKVQVPTPERVELPRSAS
jgi:ribonuclease BN (tRNA processing enzyme)